MVLLQLSRLWAERGQARQVRHLPEGRRRNAPNERAEHRQLPEELGTDCQAELATAEPHKAEGEGFHQGGKNEYSWSV